MRINLPSLVTALVVALSAPVAASAQGRVDLPAKGDWSIALGLFEEDGSTNFGVFRMLTDRLELGLEVDVSYATIEWDITSVAPTADADAANLTAGVGPSVRWFFDRDRVVSPFVRGKVSYGWGGSHLDQGTSRQSETEYATIQGSLAIGAEWNPLRWVGITGHTGLVLTHTDTDDKNNPAATRTDETRWNARTFRSGIQLKLYFG